MSNQEDSQPLSKKEKEKLRRDKRKQKKKGGRPLTDWQKQQQQAAMQQLQAVSPLATLARGYSITSNEQGNVIQQVEDIQAGDKLQTRVANGVIRSIVQ